MSRRAPSRSILSACNAGLKLALIALLAFAVARQDLPQFHGKSMTGRAIGYPVAALIVPIAWWIASRRRPRTYPTTDLGRWPLFGLAVGFGAVTAIFWELLEYVTFIRNSPELQTAYHDTLGDLTLGLSGSLLSAALVSRLGRRA